MAKSNRIINIGNTETEVKKLQHDRNPGKTIVDIFFRGKDIPDEELSDDLKETVQHIRTRLEGEKIVRFHINNNNYF